VHQSILNLSKYLVGAYQLLIKLGQSVAALGYYIAYTKRDAKHLLLD
jgi:hypothetical protein